MEKRRGYYEHGVHYKPIVQLHDEIIYGAEPMETDDELRVRLHYVIGNSRELAEACGKKLDQIADRHRLSRRQRGDFNYSNGRLTIAIDPGVDERAAAMLYSYDGVLTKQVDMRKTIPRDSAAWAAFKKYVAP